MRELYGVGIDSVPKWREEVTPYHLRIGDSVFFIPPTAITVKTVGNVSTMRTLRAKSSIKNKSGYTQTEIRVALYFGDVDQINGFKITGPGGQTYYMDGLRPLLAQFKRTPILPVVNERLNNVFDIYNVVLSSITAYTDPEFPDAMGVELIMHKTTLFPYLQRHDADFDSMICYPLFRWYYQKLLQPSSSWLQPIAGPHCSGDFKLYMLDNKAIEAKDIDAIESEIAMVQLDIPADEVKITSMSLTTHNLFSSMHAQMSTDPSHQYMGSLDTNIFVELETENDEIAKQFVELQKMVEEYSLSYHDKFVSGFVKLENELVQLFGVTHVMIHGVEVRTLEGEPGISKIAMACVSFDPQQRINENLDGFLPFHDKTKAIQQVHNVLLQNIEDAPAEWLQTMVAEEMLNNVELYPDLDLPTYAQVDEALGIINSQREQLSLPPLDFKVFIPPALRGKDYSGFRVDPDFYVKYDHLYLGGIINPDVITSAMFDTGEFGTGAIAPIDIPSDPGPRLLSQPAGRQATFELTAYCACKQCCGKDPGDPGYGVTASGAKVKQWHTIAVDPNVIPLGTWVYIPFFANKPNGGWFKAEDTGGAIKGNRIDVYYSSHQAALNFGRQWLPVIITNEKGSQPPATSVSSQEGGRIGADLAAKQRAAKTRAEFIALVKAQVGKPYVLGEEGPNKFDCSGLVQWSFKQFGVSIPRVTYEQFRTCHEISAADLKVGDLIFSRWADGKPGVPDHVGIYLGDNTIVHAKGKDYGVVQITGKSLGKDSRYFRHPGMSRVLETGTTSISSLIASDGGAARDNFAGGMDFSEELPDFIKVEQPPEMVKPYGERIQAPDPATEEGLDELARQMCHDWLKYSWDGRFVKAFPTFAMLILDEGIWMGGRRTWTNFYTYHSVLNIVVVKDRSNPVDLAVLTLSNIYGSLNARVRYKPRADEGSWFDNIFPKVDQYIVDERMHLLNKINIKPGARIHLRMGCGAVAECLPVAFNGVIADMDAKDTMTIICQGDGVELVDPILEWDQSEINSISDLTSTPWTIFYEILAGRSLMFHWGTGRIEGWIDRLEELVETTKDLGNWVKDMLDEGRLKEPPDTLKFNKPLSYHDIIMGMHTGFTDEQMETVAEAREREAREAAKAEDSSNTGVIKEDLSGYVFGAANPYGIEHFGYVYKQEGDMTFGGDPERSTDILAKTGQKKISAYDIMKNIYDRNPAYPNQVDPDTPWLMQMLGFIGFSEEEGGGGVQMYIGGKSPWDIFKTVASTQRDRIVAVHPYHFRSTLFYGMPHWPVKYALRLKSNASTSAYEKKVTISPTDGLIINAGDDRSYIWVNTLANKLGLGSPVWDPATNKITLGGKTFTPWKVENGKPLVWTRQIGNAFGWNVNWDGASQTVTFTKTVTSSSTGGSGGVIGLKKEDYEELYKPFSQFWFYNSYTNILSNGIRASSMELVTNAAAVYSIEGKPVVSKVVKADRYIKREMQKTEIFDSTTVQESIVPNFIPFTETILPFFGWSTGEERAVEMCRSHIRDKFKTMYQGELIVFGHVPKPYDCFYLNDPYSKMHGTADVGRVVIHMGFDTGFVTSIKPDLQTAIVNSERNTVCMSMAKKALDIATYTARGVLAMAVIGIGAKTARDTKLVANVVKAVKSIKNIRTALTGMSAIVGAAGLTAGASLVAVSLAPLVLWSIVSIMAFRSVARLYDWYTGKFSQEIHIYPLWYKGMPYTAGIDGHKTLIPGIQDPWYYPQPVVTEESTGIAGAGSKTGAETTGGAATPEDKLEEALQKYGYTYDEWTPTSSTQLPVPGTGVNTGTAKWDPENFMDTIRPRYFRWPTMSRKITEAHINWRKDDNGKKKHIKGLDIAGNKGDPVFVACSGIVATVGNDPSPGGLGKYVIVNHPGGSQTIYANLDKIKVSPGQQLDCRNRNNSICIIGTIGDSAKKANGKDQEEPHLHFDILGIPEDKSIFQYLE